MVPFNRWFPPTRELGIAPRLALCCLTSLMVAFAFPRVGWSFLAPLALIPLLWGTTGVSVARAALLGWVSGVATYAIAWAWISRAVQVFHDVSALDAVLPFALSQLYHGGQFAVFAGAVNWLRGGGVRVPIAATAACWGLLEWGYPKLAPWSLGVVTIDWPYIPQIADIVGVAGVSFLVAATSATLFDAVFCRELSRRRRWAPVLVLVGCYGCVALYGVVRGIHFESHRSALSADIAVVQAALPAGDRRPERASARSWRAYAAGSIHPDLSGVDVLFWPETTIREYLRHGSDYTAELSRLATALDTDVFLGALDRPASPRGEFNAIYVFGADGGTQLAHKMRLFPFGEYTPGRDWFPWPSTWRTTGSFLPGTEHPILNATGMRMASSICFEAMQPGFNNDQLRQGADLLVNLSDDSWFGDSNVPSVHLQAVRWRALEARRWLVRSSNSGISAIIDPTGAVVAQLPLGQAGSLRQRVFAETELTPFVRWGEWFVWVELSLFSMGFLVRVRRTNATP